MKALCVQLKTIVELCFGVNWRVCGLGRAGDWWVDIGVAIAVGSGSNVGGIGKVLCQDKDQEGMCWRLCVVFLFQGWGN